MGHEHEPSELGDGPSTTAIDPVCGMAVGVEPARAAGLSSRRAEVDYFFCGRGCKLDFDEDPMRYLDPGYVPAM